MTGAFSPSQSANRLVSGGLVGFKQAIATTGLPALVVGLGLILGGPAKAQTWTSLHSFAPEVFDDTIPYPTWPNGTNRDGGNPYAGVVLSGHTLYGAAYWDGIYGHGTLFSVNTDGTGFRILHQFTRGTYDSSIGANTNSDGFLPYGSLIVSDNVLFGTTYYGGSGYSGIVFRMKTDGTGFANLHSFTTVVNNDETNIDGAYPQAGVALSGDTLYGVTTAGGPGGNGTVFAVRTNGAGFHVLHPFPGVYGSKRTNNDGACPYGGVCVSGNAVYGTTYYGGTGGNGAVYRVNTDGTGFTNLHSFTAGYLNSRFSLINNDGANPAGAIIASGGTLYGTALWGGLKGEGTVFSLQTNGAGFAVLHTFSARGAYPNTTNSDGAEPWGGLVLSGRTLYGATSMGGTSDSGAVFAVTTDGAGFENLYSLSNAAMPWATLSLSEGALYGTTYYGGTGGSGTVFSLSFAPAVEINLSGTRIILSWPTNYSGFTLQAATNLTSTADWNAVSPAPVVVNGENTVTNALSGTRKFYRLSR
jgi:uncharacterized repeat protein (TIGR03803 family)